MIIRKNHAGDITHIFDAEGNETFRSASVDAETTEIKYSDKDGEHTEVISKRLFRALSDVAYAQKLKIDELEAKNG